MKDCEEIEPEPTLGQDRPEREREERETERGEREGERERRGGGRGRGRVCERQERDCQPKTGKRARERE